MDDRRNMENNTLRSRGSLSLGLRCFLLLILVISVVVFASRMLTFHQLNEEKNDLQDQKDKYQAQIDRMEHYLDGSIDYEEIVRIARERYHLTFPDETVIYSGQGIQQ